MMIQGQKFLRIHIFSDTKGNIKEVKTVVTFLGTEEFGPLMQKITGCLHKYKFVGENHFEFVVPEDDFPLRVGGNLGGDHIQPGTLQTQYVLYKPLEDATDYSSDNNLGHSVVPGQGIADNVQGAPSQERPADQTQE